MIPSLLTVDLSRIQFAVTASYHFLFVPLTLGLSWILVIMEAAYLKTGKQVYKDMTRFWGKLFAINFAMGVVTGITLEFEFGQNWAYFSRFIGDTFGTALAIEGVTAFMTEATMFGLFFFTWNKVSKKTHFLITLFLAIGTNLSIVNILVANSWMQHPVFSVLDYNTMTMHLLSFVGVYTQEIAQVRFAHVAFGSFVVAAIFVMGVSSYYLLKKQDVEFALRSYAVAVGFGLASALFVFFLGDANGLLVGQDEPEKMAAIEGQWETQPAPAAWYPIAFPNQDEERNYGVIVQIPYALSLIAYHNLTGTVEGLKPLMVENRVKVQHGLEAYKALIRLREGKGTAQDEKVFNQYRDVIGYGLLVTRYSPDPSQATAADVDKAVKDSIPEVWPVFWSFRVMLACWGLSFLVLALGFIFTVGRTIQNRRWVLWAGLFSIPLPYIAAECGWALTEIGRQPWTVRGILPTGLSTSSLDATTVSFSLGGFTVFYSILLVVELFLMFKYGRLGPSSLGEGRYHFETRTQH